MAIAESTSSGYSPFQLGRIRPLPGRIFVASWTQQLRTGNRCTSLAPVRDGSLADGLPEPVATQGIQDFCVWAFGTDDHASPLTF